MKKTTLEMKLARQIKAGKQFNVPTASQRNQALAVARILEIPIVTRAVEGGFQIIIPQQEGK